MKIIITILTLFIFISCTENERKFLFTINDATGLSEYTDIKSNGISIGKINNIDLTKNGKILITAKLNTDYKIPINSKINLSNESFFQKFINIEFGDSHYYYTKNDTIFINELKNKSMDSIIKLIDKSIYNVTVGNKIDSLNNNVKILMEKFDSI